MDTNANYDVKKNLTDLPALPGETTEASDFIGADVGEVMSDDSLSRKQRQDAIRGTLDDKGNAYDPALHGYPPSQTKGGAWKKRRASKGDTVDATANNAEYKKAAEISAFQYAQLNHIALGEGAEPDKAALAPVTQAFEQMYIERGIQKSPLWVTMALGMGGYTFHVATKPKPKKRVSGWFNSLMTWAGLRESENGDSDESGEPRKESGWFGGDGE